MTTAIEVSGLSVNYGEVVALRDVHLNADFGTIYGLVGMNGSGKSTLMKSLVGLIHPDSGSLQVAGTTPGSARKSGTLTYVPQAEEVDWDFPISVREVVMTGRYGKMGFTRRPRRTDREAVADALARVDLTELADRPIGQLSGGQKKRAFVARAIAQEARVMLLDEPFAGVDKKSEATITRLLHELAAEGACILVSTHDLVALPRLASESILLMQTVLLQGPTEKVLLPENLVRAFGIDPLAGVPSGPLTESAE